MATATANVDDIGHIAMYLKRAVVNYIESSNYIKVKGFEMNYYTCIITITTKIAITYCNKATDSRIVY